MKSVKFGPMNRSDLTTFPDQLELHDSIGDMPLAPGEIRLCLELGSEHDEIPEEVDGTVGVVAEALARVAWGNPERSS